MKYDAQARATFAEIMMVWRLAYAFLTVRYLLSVANLFALQTTKLTSTVVQ